MLTYLVTAFSFLAANFGWFGGLPQTEIFFWSDVICTIALAIILLIIFVIGGGADSGAWGILAGGFVGIIAVVLLIVNFLLCMLVAWICTQLWGLDFFLAFQVLAIGSATGQLFSAKKGN